MEFLDKLKALIADVEKSKGTLQPFDFSDKNDKPYTPPDRSLEADVLNLLKAGLGAKKIALKLDIPLTTARALVVKLRAQNPNLAVPTKAFNEAEEKIVELAKQGLTPKEISAAVGKSPENIRYYFNKHNIPFPTVPAVSSSPAYNYYANNDEAREEAVKRFDERTGPMILNPTEFLKTSVKVDKPKLRTIVILPDAHAKPKGRRDTFEPNARFTLAGKFINELRPTNVVCLGDFADMESLSSYDKGKASFEGRRYKRDLKAAIDAQKALFKEVSNRDQITFDMLYGNHEARINRAVNDDPYLDETLSLDDLKYKEYWDNVHDFKSIAMIEGIGFTHYFPNGLMDRAIGGENVAKAMMKKYPGFSLVQGHRHDLQVAYDTLADGRQIFGLVAGCFLDLEQHEDYMSTTVQKTWRRCLTVLRETPTGSWDIEIVSLERLTDMYGA